MPRHPTLSRTLLEAVLEGLEDRRRRIDGQISELRALLGKRGPGRRATSDQASSAHRKRRPLSAAARKRISDAQKKRWAAVKKQQQS